MDVLVLDQDILERSLTYGRLSPWVLDDLAAFTEELRDDTKRTAVRDEAAAALATAGPKDTTDVRQMTLFDVPEPNRGAPETQIP